MIKQPQQVLSRWGAILLLDPSLVRRAWQLRILNQGLTPVMCLVTGTLYMLLQCCFFGGMVSRVLHFCMNNCFLASFTGSVIHQNNEAFQLYHARVSHFSSKNVCHLQECITDLRKYFPFFPDCFFPLPPKKDTVSQPVKALNAGRLELVFGVCKETIS